MSVYYVYAITHEEIVGPVGREVRIPVHKLAHTTNGYFDAVEYAAKNYAEGKAFVVEAPERRARGYRRRKA